MLTLLLACAIGVDFQPVDMTKARIEGAMAYRIEDGSVNVKGRLVRSIEVGKPQDPDAESLAPSQIFMGRMCELSVVLKNRASSGLRPRIGIAVWNRYGFRLGTAYVRWAFARVDTDGTATEVARAFLVDCAASFRFTGVPLPKDFDQPAYVLIADNSD